MRGMARTGQLGCLAFVAALMLAADGFTQAPPSLPEDRGGKTDPTQLQKDRPLIDLRPIEKPKPEYEILTGPDQGIPPQEGIVIVPDEAAKAPPPQAPPATDTPPPQKKSDDY